MSYGGGEIPGSIGIPGKGSRDIEAASNDTVAVTVISYRTTSREGVPKGGPEFEKSCLFLKLATQLGSNPATRSQREVVVDGYLCFQLEIERGICQFKAPVAVG